MKAKILVVLCTAFVMQQSYTMDSSNSISRVTRVGKVVVPFMLPSMVYCQQVGSLGMAHGDANITNVTDQTGIIIGSVCGAIAFLALVGGAVVNTMMDMSDEKVVHTKEKNKKKKKKKDESHSRDIA